VAGRLLFRIEVAAEKRRLPEVAVLLSPTAVLEHAVDGREQTRTHRCRLGHRALEQRVERAALYKALDDALVDQTEIEMFGQSVQRRHAAAELLARRQQRQNRSVADVLHGGQAIADAVGLDGEVQLAAVDVGRQYGHAEIARLGEI